MKRRLRVTATLSLWWATGAVGAASARAQSITVTVGGAASSFVGTAFDAPLVVDLTKRAEKLGSFALELRWDPTVLQFVVGVDGTFGSVIANESSAGSGLLVLTGANPAGVGGLVTLGTGRFKPLKVDTTSFRITLKELYAAGTYADLTPSAVALSRQYCPGRGRYGDVEPDSKVDSRDALVALMAAVGLDVSKYDLPLADVDADGDVDPRDALIILSYGIGLDVGPFRVFTVAPGSSCLAATNPLFTLVPGDLTLLTGQLAAYALYSRDSTGTPVAVTDVHWTSSNPSVAKVDSIGDVTALAPGATVITAFRGSGFVGRANLTVVANRGTHWVDALAVNASNRLGTPSLPFATIPEALTVARGGDTIRVRPGRYADSLYLDRPLVIEGDTSGGKPRPLIAAAGRYQSGVTIKTTGRVELRALRIDTLPFGVRAKQVDTLLVRGVEFRGARSAYQASLYVDSAKAVYVQRSEFFGPGQQYYYSNDGIFVGAAAVVSIDSSFVGEYGSDGVYLGRVDSLFVRGSAIRNNLGYGVNGCSGCYGLGKALSAVFSRNRFVQNGYGHVYLDSARVARFDHNHTIGGYGGFAIYGDTGVTVLTFRGDTLDTPSGAWLTAYRFDSLGLDSAVIVVRDGYQNLNGGRIVTARDSKFLEVKGTAVGISPYPRDSTRLWLRNVEFRGPDSSSCDRCGYMISGSRLSIDADSVTMVNSYYGLDLSSSRLLLRRATLTHYYYGAYSGCGFLNISNSSFTRGSYGVELYGCGSADSMIVTNSTFTNHSSGAIYAYSVAAAVLSNSQLTNSYQAIYHSCGQLRVVNVTATGGSQGVYASGCSGTDTLQVKQSSFTGFTNQGVYLSSGPAVVTNSTFTDDATGVQVQYAPAVVTDNQVIRPRSYGIYYYWYGAAGSARVLNNTISCDFYGATNATAVYVYRYAGSDTVTTQSNSISNCNSGIAVYGGRQGFVRGNTVSLPKSPVGYNGILVDSDSSSVVVGNTVSGFGSYGSIRIVDVRSARADSNVVSDAINAGLIFPGSYDTLRVRDNTITKLGYLCCGVSPSGAIQTNGASSSNVWAEVRRNRVTGTTNGILLQRGYLDTVTVQLDSNTVRNADSIGIWVRYYSKARIRYSAIDSTGLDGVRISDIYNTFAAAVLDSNNFTRSQHLAVRNLSSYQIDASDNWWGDATGPRCVSGCDPKALGDSVSALVTFQPVLPAPFATLAPAPPLVAAVPVPVAPLVTDGPAGGTSAAWQPVSRPAPPPVRARVAAPAQPVAVPDAPPTQSSDPAVRRLEAAANAWADRLRTRQAEEAQRSEQRAAERVQRERQRAERREARAAERRALEAAAQEGPR